MKHKPAQSGSVLFIILIAIALFAALSYAFLRGSSGNVSQLTDHQATMAAQEIIAYGNTMADAVQKMKLRGCTDVQIDFSDHNGTSKTTDDTATIYDNPHSPSDGSCSIFGINGGKVNPQLINSGYSDVSAVPAGYSHPQALWLMAMGIKDIGSDATDGSGTDLIVQLGRLQKNVCIKINELLGVPNPSGSPPEPLSYCLSGGTTFEGSYPACSNPMGTDQATISGQAAFCWKASGTEQYAFYKVLIAR